MKWRFYSRYLQLSATLNPNRVIQFYYIILLKGISDGRQDNPEFGDSFTDLHRELRALGKPVINRAIVIRDSAALILEDVHHRKYCFSDYKKKNADVLII